MDIWVCKSECYGLGFEIDVSPRKGDCLTVIAYREDQQRFCTLLAQSPYMDFEPHNTQQLTYTDGKTSHAFVSQSIQWPRGGLDWDADCRATLLRRCNDVEGCFQKRYLLVLEFEPGEQRAGSWGQHFIAAATRTLNPVMPPSLKQQEIMEDLVKVRWY